MAKFGGPGGYVGGRPKDLSKLSKDPAQIRRRLRRAAKGDKQADGRIGQDMEMLYRKPISEWDMEELARGRPRNKSGTFQGKQPTWINPQVQMEAKRRLITETYSNMAIYGSKAIKVIYKLMMCEDLDDKGKPIVDARTRLAAATYILDHIMGKATASVTVATVEDAVRSALVPAIILDDGLPQGHLIEGEIVEQEEEMDDDGA